MVKVYPEHSEKEKNVAQRFRHLHDVLREELIDISVYRVGETSVEAYIKYGDYAGIKPIIEKIKYKKLKKTVPGFLGVIPSFYDKLSLFSGSYLPHQFGIYKNPDGFCF